MASADPTSRAAAALRYADWVRPGRPWSGRVEGQQLGTNVTVLFFSSDEVGAGPVLHTHPYDEVFIVREGRAEFTLGAEKHLAEAGDILMAPAEMPHKFRNLGPGPLSTTDIHLSDRQIQVDLEP